MILSRRAYALHRKAKGLAGGTINAVKTAIDDGRLVKSLTPDGRIADAAAADAEWAATTLTNRIPISGPAATRTVSSVDDAEPSGSPSRLQVLRERREAVQVELAELELAERRGQLIEVEQARRDVIDKFSTVRTRILGVPTRIAQRIPKLADEIVPLLDELLREALEDLADGGAG